MAGLSRAAAVSERDNLSASPEPGDDCISGCIRSRLESLDASFDYLLMLAEMSGEVLCRHARIIPECASPARELLYPPRRRRRPCDRPCAPCRGPWRWPPAR